ALVLEGIVDVVGVILVLAERQVGIADRVACPIPLFPEQPRGGGRVGPVVQDMAVLPEDAEPGVLLFFDEGDKLGKAVFLGPVLGPVGALGAADGDELLPVETEGVARVSVDAVGLALGGEGLAAAVDLGEPLEVPADAEQSVGASARIGKSE